MTNMTREQEILTKVLHPKISEKNKLEFINSKLQLAKNYGYLKAKKESKGIRERKKYRFSEYFKGFIACFEKELTPDKCKR